MPGIAASYTATSVAIASGQSLSGALELNMGKLARISMPAAWDAANLTFQVLSADGLTYQNLYDSFGNEYTVTAAAAREIIVNLADFLCVTSAIKIRSGTSGVPVVQSADRTVRLSLVV